jgi:acetoin utilization protein AcuB
MFVRSWMTSPVVAVETSASILDGLRVMEMRRIRRLPVLSGDALAGIVTREDLHAYLGYGEGAGRDVELPLERAMRSPVRTVSPDDTLERAAELMLEHEVSGLPVVEGERVVGMITESDVFRAFTRLMGIREPGARVVMAVAEGADLVDEIVKRAGGLSIRSLAASPAAAGGWDVVMRVRGRAAATSASPR